MEDMTQLSCESFVEVLASKEPVPGGGGAAALVGAVGTALGNMVGSLTVGKPKYASVEKDICQLNTRAQALEARLLELIRRDAVVFEPLSRAYGLPKGTDEERAHKTTVMESCLKACAEVPLEIMMACADAIELQEEYAAKGTSIAISDVGCGVICCKAALQAASLNVFINTKSMTDRDHAERVNAKAHTLLDEYTAKADAIFASVARSLQ
jgi:formiminotetrahydrofolate cyclodeaminase